MDGREEEGVAFVTLYARIVYELAKNPRMAQETLARRLNVTMRTVQRHLNALEQDGYIRVARDRKPFAYDIAWDRPLPHFDQLNVKTFRPDVVEKVAALEQQS